ncbi:MAG: PASTA domain-containing protein [Oscillospiraceae bacterium]|jgi:stage V sporulation protein D (sporulation-specific penicillin-binding protein)|nr:PASTA domain-containing protein [Oscillospiraceae bacterium]
MTIRKRLLWLTAALPLLFCLILLKVGELTIARSSELTSRGIQQWTRNGTVSAARGQILDRNGRTITQSVTAYIVSASPNQVTDPEKMADILCPALGLDRDTVITKLSQKGVGSVTLKRQVPRDTVNSLRDMLAREDIKASGALKGLTFGEDRLRYYPLGRFMPQVLGLTNIDGDGQSGLEQQYNAALAGSPGRIITEVDNNARALAGGQEYYIAPQEGASLKLTIDQTIQSIMDKAMRECVEVNGAAQAMAIAMDPRTGAILGMSMEPDYDPNNPPRDDLATLQRLMRITLISDAYEPGSTWKMFTAAMALDLGLTTPDEGFFCNGSIVVDGDTIRCWNTSGHGAEDFRKALQNSCNPVFVQMGLRVGIDNFYRYMSAFGFGKTTGIDLPGESAGILIPKSTVKKVELARIGFGQSVAVTPIQMIAACCAIANGGKLMKPYLVSEIIGADGSTLERATPQVVSRPISEETSALTRDLLETVVADGGGRNAKIEGYRIAGKTGTAQVYKEGKVAHDAHIGSFMGFAPADDPVIAVLVIVNEARLMPDYGSATAAPFARDILEQSLQYMGVRADKGAVKQVQATVPDLVGMSVPDATAALESLGLTAVTDGDDPMVLDQMPAPGASVWTQSQVMLYTREGQALDAQTLVHIPDLRGMSIIEAGRQLRSRGLIMEIDGAGLAVRQRPAAGEFAQPGDTVTVYFEAP